MSESSPVQDPGWRPRLHFTAPHGWINDPNGLVRVGTAWHLHYQFEWPRCWGHATSEDLFHWKHLPVALKPDALGDCWSGCTVIDEGNTSGLFAAGTSGLVSIYTSQDETIGQRISLASSHDGGVTWQTASFNPVLKRPQKGCRDPKVFWDRTRGRWALVLTEDHYLTFFISGNLREWTETGRFTPIKGEGVDGFECPDLFQLPVENRPGESKWILVTSYLSGRNFVADGYGPCAQRCFVGEYDGATFTVETGAERLQPFGNGPDEYAAIVWPRETDGERRTLAIGWMNHWGYAKRIPTDGWQGNLTLPRELTLHEDGEGKWTIHHAPARELWALPQARIPFPPARLEPGEGPRELGRFTCGAVKGRFRFEPRAILKFAVFAGRDGETTVTYDHARGVIGFDRRDSGSPKLHPDFSRRQEVPLEIRSDGQLDLTVVIDQSTVEVFVADSGVYLSGLTFPRAGSDAVTLQAMGGTVTIDALEIVEFS